MAAGTDRAMLETVVVECQLQRLDARQRAGVGPRQLKSPLASQNRGIRRIMRAARFMVEPVPMNSVGDESCISDEFSREFGSPHQA